MQPEVAIGLQQLAYAQLSLARYPDCVAPALEARRCFDEERDPFHERINASVLARACARLDDLVAARKYHEEAVAHLRSAVIEMTAPRWVLLPFWSGGLMVSGTRRSRDRWTG